MPEKTQPTDAEILELASQYWECLDETESATEIELVRAALAKWGTPAVAGKPVAWWIPKAEQFCLADKSGDRPFAKAWEPLYTTPQPTKPQAGAVPLTDGQIESLLYKYGYDADDEHMAAMLKEAHGIKGGQHGTE